MRGLREWMNLKVDYAGQTLRSVFSYPVGLLRFNLSLKLQSGMTYEACSRWNPQEPLCLLRKIKFSF